MDTSSLICDVHCTDWDVVVRRDETCERQWECLCTEMNRILDIHAPVRRFRVHNPSPPPVSDDTLELMAQRKNAKKTGSPETYKQLNIAVKKSH